MSAKTMQVGNKMETKQTKNDYIKMGIVTKRRNTLKSLQPNNYKWVKFKSKIPGDLNRT